MPDQAHFWSKAAEFYEREFVDPYRSDVKNPLLKLLRRIRKSERKTVADLGCGTAPLLPFLAERFAKVLAIDFAEGMLERARKSAADAKKIRFLRYPLTNLEGIGCRADVAIA